MSNTGKTFTAQDLPVRERTRPDADAKAAALTKRYRIVARDKTTGRGYIAEELQERILRTLSPNARIISTMMMMFMSDAERREVVRAFDAKGNLLSPFKKA